MALKLPIARGARCRPAEDAGATTTPIEPGSQELTVDVGVRYSIV